MSADGPPVGDAALGLRREFDRSFASAPMEDRAFQEDFLALRAGGDVYAVRLTEVAGLFAGRAVASLPSPVAGMLGISGVGGALLPVYDLGVLLGGAPAQAPRWMLVAAGAPVAFAFEAFEGQLRVPRNAVTGGDRGEARRAHAHEVLRTEGRLMPILQLSRVIRGVEDRVRQGAPQKEK